MQSRGKDKTTAGILGILLGSLGVHQFYLGSTMTGVIEIALTCVTCGIGSLLGLVEGILILVMDQNEFDQRYNFRTPESVEFVFMKPKTMTPPPSAPTPPYQG
ncbi:MAG TPA: TM2 domain-containing protein [Thermoanaerobaculia bacterium]|jgi:TM2 domain-containing membrane protein YozV|nr:TM2 domain-containing protein [Thermoanaerobaculia bacterium]